MVKSLTPAELRCMRALAEGHTAITAGKELFVSPKTIKAHAASARQKLDALNTTHAIALLFRMGLIDETQLSLFEEEAG